MSYLGNEPQFTQYPSKFFNGNGTAQTVALDYAPPNAAAKETRIHAVSLAWA